jgi:cytochrome c
MKRTLLFLSTITLLLAACGGSSTETANTNATATAPVADKPAMEPGELLIVKSDCIGCHHKEDKLIGPAYQEVAAKYPSTDENINLLASKIVKGGKGVWGQIPMTPHTKITEEDAKLMVKYILSLKK